MITPSNREHHTLWLSSTESRVMENEKKFAMEMGKVREREREARIESQVAVDGSEQGLEGFFGVKVLMVSLTTENFI